MPENRPFIENREPFSLGSLFFIFNRKNLLQTLLILLLFLLGGLLFILKTTPKYSSYTSLEITLPSETALKANEGNNFLNSLNLPATNGLETEINILSSRSLIAKAIHESDDLVRLYKPGLLRDKEIFKDTPLLVSHLKIKDPKIYSERFLITPLDGKSFKIAPLYTLKDRIMIALKMKKRRPVQTLSFDKLIQTNTLQFALHPTAHFSSNPVILRFVNMEAQIKSYEKSLAVKPGALNSHLVEVSAEDTNPYRIRDFLNALVSEYIRQNVDKKSKDATITLQFINRQLKEVDQALRSSAKRLKDFKAKHTFVDLSENARQIGGRLVTMEEKLNDAEMALNNFLTLERLLKKGDYDAIGSLGQQYPVLLDLIRELEAQNEKRSRLLIQFTPQHPEVVQTQKSIARLKRSIAKTASGIHKMLQKRVSLLKKRLQKARKTLRTLPAQEQEMIDLEREYRINEKLYSDLLQKKSELTIIKSSHIPDARIIDEASLPDRPAKPNKPITLMTSLFFGLVTALLFALMRTNRKIRTKEDLLRLSHIPLFGSIPFIKEKSLYNQVYALKRPDSKESEALREIITNLRYLPGGNGSKVIVITSTVPNEGKTVTTANLAAMLGMGDKKTILLSLDLRNPELHKKFGIPNDKGMSDILSSQESFEKVVWEHHTYHNLNIVPSGHIPPNPYELITSKKMRDLLDRLKKEYDYIIIDTPPVSMVSDAIALMKMADINIFVVKSDFSDANNIKMINALVEQYDIHNAGIILNSLKERYETKNSIDTRYIRHKERIKAVEI
ncbi:MAG: hypothetical protein B6D59_06430 [Campylobacteraceae bacterium 4484_4]|nr:MAG: hypothetical protein B6D59_06430 [Campylobacteraceae bacterium 4484_4]